VSPPTSDHPTVFLSYSRKDKRWLEALQTMLAPLVRNGVVDIWWDGEIKPSQEWRAEIDRALASARIGVLLVSSNFLASDFIAQKELPYLIEAAEKRKVTLFWVLLSPCLHEETSLRDIQAAHEIAHPLDALGKAKRGAVLKSICQKIAEAARSDSAPAGGAGIKPGASAPGQRSPISPSPERAQASVPASISAACPSPVLSSSAGRPSSPGSMPPGKTNPPMS
jgi:hypothetical protein